MSARVIRGDVLRFCALYRGPLVHALLCDPPYHLVDATGKRGQDVDRAGEDWAIRPRGGTQPFRKPRGGFMGKSWDGGDVAFDPATWAALGTLMHPGAFGMAFGSSRGYHRLACAIEDAGMIIHPTIFGWAYGSGFPKATRIDTQVDKAAGAERAAIGVHQQPARTLGNDLTMDGGDAKDIVTLTAPATPLAAQWAGHRYGLQALKPALEPIIVFQKPYPRKVKTWESITATGAGALWIDGGRIAATADDLGDPERFSTPRAGNDSWDRKDNGMFDSGRRGGWAEGLPAGRWPANFYLSHTPACNGTCAPDCPVRLLGEQSGESASKAALRGDLGDIRGDNYGRTKGVIEVSDYIRGHNDTGTAARFFHNADWSHEVAEQLAAAEPVRYVAKAGRKERDAGLEAFAEYTDMDLTSGDRARENARAGTNRNGPKSARNPHPTIKPITLTRWLATLLLPPEAYAPRRILVPFAGAGSEAIGAMLAGWEEVIGIERENEYADIARARIAHWAAQERQEVLL